MIRIFFATLELTIEHVQKFGGWIAVCNDGTFQWFDASKFTLTPVLTIVGNHGGGEVGGWALFDEEMKEHVLNPKKYNASLIA